MIFKGFNLSRKAFIVLLLTFAVSVVIRIPNINRPLSKHHEFVTAISLRVLQIWNEDGGAKYNFVPVMNYPGAANKHINNHASPTEGMKDLEGNYYYVSHPPLGYMIPHFVFKVFHVKPTVLSLQIFHLFINFFSGLCIYLIVISMKRSRARSDIDKTALLAFVIYIFSSAVLWFQCNTYMSDMLVHSFFLVAILLGLKCLNYPSSIRWRILFAINLFLMVYTSWLGVFFALIVVVFGVFYWREKRGVQLAIFTSLSTILAFGLIYFQYSSINGSDAFLQHLTQRLDVRGSGMGGRSGGLLSTKLSEIGIVIFNYAANYLAIILVIIVALILAWRKSLTKLREYKSFIVFSIFPVLLLHLILLNYSGHDFTVLYASCFLSIIAALLIENQIKAVRTFALWFVIFGSIGVYYYVNRPGDYSLKEDRYDTSMQLGKKIKNEAKEHEVVYLISYDFDPMLVLYAERNIVYFSPFAKGKFPKLDREKPFVVFWELDGTESRVLRNEEIQDMRELFTEQLGFFNSQHWSLQIQYSRHKRK